MLFTKGSLERGYRRLGEYRYEGAMLRYLQSWLDQRRWQRLKPFERLAWLLLDHLGILNYCRTRIAMGVVEAIPETSRPCCDAAEIQEPPLLVTDWTALEVWQVALGLAC